MVRSGRKKLKPVEDTNRAKKGGEGFWGQSAFGGESREPVRELIVSVGPGFSPMESQRDLIRQASGLRSSRRDSAFGVDLVAPARRESARRDFFC